jgi:protein-export membrane protein SecD/preprotein translocase SecF subunit
MASRDAGNSRQTARCFSPHGAGRLIWKGSQRAMKPLTGRIVRCLVPIVIGLLVCGIAFWNFSHPPMKVFGWPVFARLKPSLGVDLVGGTILVYEIDPDKKPENYNKDQLIAALKRRLDPADLYNITIRPLSETRVEIILPTGGRFQAQAGEGKQALTGEKVEEIKELIQRVGSLEFRILANTHDDADAIKAARQYFQDASKQWNESLKALAAEEPFQGKVNAETLVKEVSFGDLATLTDQLARAVPGMSRLQISRMIETQLGKSDRSKLNELIERARQDLSPPAPEQGGERLFKITLEDGDHRVSYGWVELGKNELHSLGLNSDAQNATGDDAWKKEPWLAAERIRHQGVAADSMTVVGGRLGSPWSNLLYSRKIPKQVRDRLLARDKGKEYEYFVLTRNPEPGRAVTGEYLTSAKEEMDRKGGMAVGFRFNAKGANLFRELTTANRPAGEGGGRRHLAVVLDGQIQSAPSLNAIISDSGIIEGRFTKIEIDRLVGLLRAGALPATLKPQPVSENMMGATLGDDTIRAGLHSIGFAFLAVLIFMLFYYRFAGFVACTALLANLLLTVAFMMAVQATFTLPGLAGLVLTLAMAVDANVLIYERIREERDRGASLTLAIRNGYDRAFPTVIDTHLSSIFTAIVLYVVGNDQLKGFGISLTVGLIISLFTALYVTRTIFDLFMARGWLKKLSMGRMFSRVNIQFMSIRRPVFIATICFALFGVTLFLLRGTSALNMDFIGGTVYGGKATEFLSVGELREMLSDKRQEERLALAQDPERVGQSDNWRLVYKEGDVERTVFIPAEANRSLSPAEVRRRAEILPEPSPELIYSSDAELTREGESKLFAVRTTEKASDLVASSISRLVGDKLERTKLEDYSINQVTLNFRKPIGQDQAREAVLKALREAKLIKPLPTGTRQRAIAARVGTVAPLGGGPLSAVAALASGPLVDAGGKQEISLTALGDPTVPQDRFLLRFDNPVDGETLDQALETLATGPNGLLKETKAAKDGKPATFPFSITEAHISLTNGAYPSQVRALLERQFDKYRQDRTLPLELRVNPLGDGEENRYASLNLELTNPIGSQAFRAAMKSFSDELASRPLPVRLENFDSQLAADTQQRALYAIIASWGAMLLYLWFRFGNWTFGLAAVICLIHDVCFTLGLIALAHYIHGSLPAVASLLDLQDFKIDLPAVASLLTLIGFSVNDTIVVFDRIREVRGKNPYLTPEMINDSINQTLSRTILTSVIAWLVVLVLYIWGGEGIHLFAFVMVVGVLIGTYSSIYVASPLLLLLGEGAPRGAARERMAERQVAADRK